MNQAFQYRTQVLETILLAIKNENDVLAIWEGGSMATGTSDEFSDIDLCILTDSSQIEVLSRVESSLKDFRVIHTWQPAKNFWGEGMMQRVIVLKDAPKYFSIDVAVFSLSHPQILKEFLEIERHGTPKVYVDKKNYLLLGHTDAEELFSLQQKRMEELNQGFPIFKTLTMKEIERGHSIDAISFYQIGMLRPLIEILGMIYRPFKADFGMRYLHQSFPLDMQNRIQDLAFVRDIKDLETKVIMLEQIFKEAVNSVRARSKL